MSGQKTPTRPVVWESVSSKETKAKAFQNARMMAKEIDPKLDEVISQLEAGTDVAIAGVEAIKDGNASSTKASNQARCVAVASFIVALGSLIVALFTWAGTD